jgi:hypothetical protein
MSRTSATLTLCLTIHCQLPHVQRCVCRVALLSSQEPLRLHGQDDGRDIGTHRFRLAAIHHPLVPNDGDEEETASKI